MVDDTRLELEVFLLSSIICFRFLLIRLMLVTFYHYLVLSFIIHCYPLKGKNKGKLFTVQECTKSLAVLRNVKVSQH